jgi:hypothetical protein
MDNILVLNGTKMAENQTFMNREIAAQNDS